MSALQFPVFFRTMDVRGEGIVRDAVAATIKDAEALWAPEKFGGIFGTSGFGIKKLQPADLNGTSTTTTGFVSPIVSAWVFSINTAETWSTIVSACILSDSSYVILCGIFNYDANPDVEAIKITADGIEYAVIDITELYGWDIAEAYWANPIVIRPQKKITIEAKARTAGQKNFGFLGFTVAKRSYLIGKI